jgi:hypothetical protein
VDGGTPGGFSPATILEVNDDLGGDVDENSLNGRGFYVTQSPTVVTATLDIATAPFNWCAYGSGHAPAAEAQAGGGYKLTGTPPFTINGDTKELGYYFGAGTCITSITDLTQHPGGIIPTLPEVASVSASTPCAGSAATLTATPSGGTTTAMTYTWNIGGTQSSTTAASITTQNLTATTTYTVTARNAYGCTSPVSNKGTITVHALPTITSLSGSTAQTVTEYDAMAVITYTTSDATGATVTGLPDGVSGAWVNNAYTISGTPSTYGVFTYTVTTTNSNGCANATATGEIVVNIILPPYSNSSWSCGNQVWSGAVRNPAGCTATSCENMIKQPTDTLYMEDPYDASLGYFYNWSCVSNFATVLCPSPWHVPNYSDLVTLTQCPDAGSVNWGWGNMCYLFPFLHPSPYEGHGYIWSQDEHDDDSGYMMRWCGAPFEPEDCGTLLGITTTEKHRGLNVLCVR